MNANRNTEVKITFSRDYHNETFFLSMTPLAHTEAWDLVSHANTTVKIRYGGSACSVQWLDYSRNRPVVHRSRRAREGLDCDGEKKGEYWMDMLMEKKKMLRSR